jgi:TRAP-type C4-dicarboxylate transport system permease small subunit
VTLARAFGRALDGVAAGLFALACAALAAIVAVTAFEVVARYAFAAPSRWASDGAGYLLAAAIMLAVPEVTRRRGHVAITLLSDRAPATWGRILTLTAAGTCLAAAWIAGGEAARQAARGLSTAGAAPIPKAWLTGAVTLGFAGAGLEFLRQTLAPRA